MIVVWLFLPVPWVCLQFVFVVFPDHIHLFGMHWVAVAGDNDICINIFTPTAHVLVELQWLEQTWDHKIVLAKSSSSHPEWIMHKMT